MNFVFTTTKKLFLEYIENHFLKYIKKETAQLTVVLVYLIYVSTINNI